MNAAAQAHEMPHAKPAGSLQMIATLGVVSTLSGLLVVLVYQVTKDRIADNERRALEAAITVVLPDTMTARATFAVEEDGFRRL